MKTLCNINGLKIGCGQPARVMGVINVSPESFYKGSIQTNQKQIARTAERMEKDGADIIDVGAMGTAPYLETHISDVEEARRLTWAVTCLRKVVSLPISIDTSRHNPAEAGLAAGAQILNDITGFHLDPALPALAAYAKAVILMAHPASARKRILSSPIRDVKTILQKSLALALQSGLTRSKIILDPGIGFFRKTRLAWWLWDLSVLHNLEELGQLGAPLLIGVSRKSFIGHLLGGKPPEARLAGSLAATALAVWNGASLIRTHDVKETVEAIKIADSTRHLRSF